MKTINIQEIKNRIKELGNIDNLGFRVTANDVDGSIEISFFDLSVMYEDEVGARRKFLFNTDYKLAGSFQIKKGNPNAVLYLTVQNLQPDYGVNPSNNKKAKANKALKEKFYLYIINELAPILDGTIVKATRAYKLDDEKVKTDWVYLFTTEEFSLDYFYIKTKEFIEKNNYKSEPTLEELNAELINNLIEYDSEFLSGLSIPGELSIEKLEQFKKIINFTKTSTIKFNHDDSFSYDGNSSSRSSRVRQ